MSRLLNSQDGEDLYLSNADHFNEEIMHRKRLIPSLHQTLQSRVHRVGTLKGLPRLFLLKRAFCLYWGVIISLFIYLKWYYPLYLTRTAIRSTVQDFSTDWCRMRNARIDWKRIREPCEGNTVYEQHLPGWGEENRTNGRYSFVESVDIRPAGEFSRITLQSLTAYGDPKAVGGDYWRVFISGPTGFAPTVFDNGNGFYEILFLVLHPGNYCVSAVLDHSMCEGMKDPPDYWFISGNIHGSNQSPGILKGKQVYLMQPLMGGEPLCFNVPASHGPMIRDEFLSYGLGHPSHCGTGCKFLSDGFGYWMNDTWIAHAPVYRQLIDDIIATFKEKWKNEFGEEQLKFRGKLIWKTTTAIHRERFLYHDHPSPRFLTLQRIQLYNAYAIWAMCKAGFEVLDVFPMSYSYPGGTDGRFDRHDAVHFKNTVFKPAEQLLHEYFSPYEGKDNKKRLYNRLYHNKNYSL
ncbi:uncharacterized protein [Montipora foliosa]|uniref:uncharacterized protein isoform X2 n=1 Tax=Montipora foliosa TaxID=591990 RepID=UPI0035F1018B